MADLGLLDEVINVVILLTFNKGSANLNRKYAMKVYDYSYNKVRTAEEAVLRIREKIKRAESKTAKTKTRQKPMFLNG